MLELSESEGGQELTEVESKDWSDKKTTLGKRNVRDKDDEEQKEEMDANKRQKTKK